MSIARFAALALVSLTLLPTTALRAQNPAAVGSRGSVLGRAAAAAPEDDTLETRHYELAGLGPDHRHDDLSFALLPFLHDVDRGAGDDHLEFEDLMYTLLQDVVAPDQFQYAGREINALEDGRLEVIAPAAVHVDVQRLIDALAQGFRRRATLELSVERIADGAGVAKQLAERSADELRSAGLLMPARVQSVELFVGQGHRLRSELRHQITRGWESEIAQTATSVIPVAQELRTGLDLLLRLEAEPDGGYRLRSVGWLGELLSNDLRSVSVQGNVMNEAGFSRLFDRKDVDDTVVSWAALTGAARLAPGESTQQLLWTRTQSGFAGWLVGLRLIDVQPAPLVVFGERAVTVVDFSSQMWPAQHEGEVTSDGEYSEDFTPGEITWPSMAWGAEGRSWGVNSYALSVPMTAWDHAHEANVDAIYELGGDAWVEGNWAVVSGDTQLVRDWLAQRASAASPSRSLILEVGVESQERGGATLQGPQARAQLTLLEGDALTALVGEARRYVAEFETDVAQGATITSPELGDLFDGMLLSARSASGQVTLEVELGRLLSELGNHGAIPNLAVDAPQMLSARFSARLSPNGERKSLGEIAPGFGDGPRLQLWARLRQVASAN